MGEKNLRGGEKDLRGRERKKDMRGGERNLRGRERSWRVLRNLGHGEALAVSKLVGLRAVTHAAEI